MEIHAWTKIENMATTRSQSKKKRSRDTGVAGRVKAGRERARKISFAPDPVKKGDPVKAMDEDVIVVEEEEEKKIADDEMQVEIETSLSGEGDEVDRPRPVGEAIENGGKKKRFAAFEYDGNRFELEDTVLITPEVENTKPGLGIIKGISLALDGSMLVAIQWFYRPEDVKTTDGETWSPADNREILISDHLDEVPANCILHKCVVHFLPCWEWLPCRKAHPGFIVHHFYHCQKKEVYNISDGKFTDSLRREIDLRIRKTQLRFGFEEL